MLSDHFFIYHVNPCHVNTYRVFYSYTIIYLTLLLLMDIYIVSKFFWGGLLESVLIVGRICILIPTELLS